MNLVGVNHIEKRAIYALSICLSICQYPCQYVAKVNIQNEELL